MAIWTTTFARESKQTQCARPRLTCGPSLWILFAFAPLPLFSQASFKLFEFLLFGGFELIDV
jgi:hypothetical protein